MLTSNIHFTKFKIKKKNNRTKNELKFILKENIQVIHSLTKKYKNNYKKKEI